MVILYFENSQWSNNRHKLITSIYNKKIAQWSIMTECMLCSYKNLLNWRAVSDPVTVQYVPLSRKTSQMTKSWSLEGWQCSSIFLSFLLALVSFGLTSNAGWENDNLLTIPHNVIRLYSIPQFCEDTRIPALITSSDNKNIIICDI